jgi:hypothetical protein
MSVLLGVVLIKCISDQHPHPVEFANQEDAIDLIPERAGIVEIDTADTVGSRA